MSYQIDWLLSLLSITAAQVKAFQPLCEHLAQSLLIYLDVLKKQLDGDLSNLI